MLVSLQGVQRGLKNTLCALCGEYFTIYKDSKMDKYVCIPCEYVYDPKQGDPENGIAPGTRFEDLPDDWQCPVCFVDKDEFEKIPED